MSGVKNKNFHPLLIVKRIVSFMLTLLKHLIEHFAYKTNIIHLHLCKYMKIKIQDLDFIPCIKYQFNGLEKVDFL